MQSIAGSACSTPHILFTTGVEPTDVVRATVGANPVWEVTLSYGILEVEVGRWGQAPSPSVRH